MTGKRRPLSCGRRKSIQIPLQSKKSKCSAYNRSSLHFSECYRLMRLAIPTPSMSALATTRIGPK